MPGENANPNINAAKTIAFTYNLLGHRELFLDEFNIEDSTDKAQKLCSLVDKTNVMVRFEANFFHEFD